MARAKRVKCSASGGTFEIPAEDWLKKETRCPTCGAVVGFFPQYQAPERKPGVITAKLRDHTHRA